jgi:hypothetical protein
MKYIYCDNKVAPDKIVRWDHLQGTDDKRNKSYSIDIKNR